MIAAPVQRERHAENIAWDEAVLPDSLRLIDLASRVMVLEEMLHAALDVAHSAIRKHDDLQRRYNHAIEDLRIARAEVSA